METVLHQKDQLGLGFIGVGWIGQSRMRAILENTNATAKAIAEPSPDNVKAAEKIAPKAKVVANHELLDSRDINAVVIATPSAMHAEQAIEALGKGKAVFCQKPLGRTAEEVKKVVEASKKADKLLSVDLSYRYTRAFEAIQELIKSGELGEIYAVDLVFHNAYGPDKEWFYDLKKSGGGCVMDLGIHLVDMALLSLNFPQIKEINSQLYSKGRKIQFEEKEVEDFAKVNMLTDTGLNINLTCSWNASVGKDAIIEASFYGTQGGCAFKNKNGSFYDFYAEKYSGTNTEVLEDQEDQWGGRAGVVWANELSRGKTYDSKSALEFIKTAEVIDRIYGR